LSVPAESRRKSAAILPDREIPYHEDLSVTKTNISKLTGFLLVMAALLVASTDRAKAAELSAPMIYVDAPVSNAPVNPPVQVALHFEAPNGSQIDVASFQVLYQFGIFKKDITKQILRFVTLTSAGLTGSTPPDLPPGVHTLIIRIRDTQHRLGEQILSLRVGR
jgi:hypothetical protein